MARFAITVQLEKNADEELPPRKSPPPFSAVFSKKEDRFTITTDPAMLKPPPSEASFQAKKHPVVRALDVDETYRPAPWIDLLRRNEQL